MTTPRIFGTKEWAVKTANCIEGCANDCKYCYAKSMAIRFNRRTPENWPQETPRLDWIKKACRGRPCRVMFPSTHDITPGNLDICLKAIDMLLKYGHEVLIVTKAHGACIKRIMTAFDSFKEQILFRITIGSTSPDNLSFWEPHAPHFFHRSGSLIYAHNNGFRTSVSCEPMLDETIPSLVSETEDYVTDSIWLGKANHLRQRLRINGAGPETLEEGDLLMAEQNDEYIRALYAKLKDHPKVKWKESIKKIVGLDLATEAGLDQ